MSRKLLAANLTFALVLVGLGVLQARHDANRTRSVPTWSARSGGVPLGVPLAGRNLLVVEGFESEMRFAVSEGYAPVAYGPPPPPGGSGAFWGRSMARAMAGLFSAWCAGAGPASPAVPPYGLNCTPYSPYLPGPCRVPLATNTTMTAGPYNLTGYTTGSLRFSYWLSTELADPFSVQASVDGSHFYGFLYYGANPTGQMQLQLTSWPALGDLTGRPSVWFRFGYAANASGRYEGVYIDDITLEVGSPDLIFGDSFELGDSSAWSFTTP
jgi:hypothetical protein